jgi:hypothetical protein
MFKGILYFITGLIVLFSYPDLMAQEWEFAKEKDAIRVFTRDEPGTNYKAFRGEVELKAPMEEVVKMVEDVEQFDVWDKDVTEIRVLSREPGKMLKYYVVYDVPWPFTDRDLCVEAKMSLDPVTGARLLQAASVPEAVPLNEDYVRIVNYWQKWIIQPKADGTVHLVVEGYADPAGDIPAWVANMAITDTPLNMLGAIRGELAK